MNELLKSRYLAIAAFIVVNVTIAWLTGWHEKHAGDWAAQAIISLGSISLLLAKSLLTWGDKPSDPPASEPGKDDPK